MLGKFIPRVGKDVAEIALQFIADGMDIPTAIRSGSAIMDRPLGNAAADLVSRVERIRNKSLDERNIVDSNFRNIDEFRGNRSTLQKSISNEEQKTPWFISKEPINKYRSSEMSIGRSFKLPPVANGYAIRQLILDAAEGDPSMAELIAKRLDLDWLL